MRYLFHPFLACSLLCWTSTQSLAQFEIGNTVITFFDQSRNRDIETHIYYPADAAGMDVPVSNGLFPVVCVGHGFAMNYDSYQYLWEHLVPLGYIVALPATETGLITVSHGDFGQDLAYVISSIQAEGTDMSSLFFEKVAGTSAVMGHSMGGGASFLAVENDTTITTMISFAAAETNPSAIAVANNISIPTLTFTATEDCVAPEAGNQLDMYQNLSDCKAYATILDGSHCQFANSNTLCELGEIICFGANYISESAQHTVIKDIITPWLDTWLYNDISRWFDFTALLGSGLHYELAMECVDNAPDLSTSVPADEPLAGLSLFPNPFHGKTMLQLGSPIQGRLQISVYNAQGRLVHSEQIDNPGQQLELDLSHLNQGFFIAEIRANGKRYKERLVKH